MLGATTAEELPLEPGRRVLLWSADRDRRLDLSALLTVTGHRPLDTDRVPSRIDAALVDGRQDGRRALSMVSRIRAAHPGLVIVVIAHRYDDVFVREARLAGAVVLVPPFSSAALTLALMTGGRGS